MTTRDMSVKSLHKAAKLLDCFTRDRPCWTLTELAATLRMHPTTAFRLLATLQEVGYVSQDGRTKQYRLGLKLLELGARVRAGLDLVREADEILRRLALESGESTYLTILQDGHVVYISAVDSNQAIKTSASIGERRPVHTTGTGKVFLAYLDSEQRAAVLPKRLITRGPQSITDHSELERALAEIRRVGYSISYEEDQVGLVSVAAPVFSTDGLVAAVSIAGPAFRLPRAALVELSEMVMAATALLSQRLGVREPAGRL